MSIATVANKKLKKSRGLGFDFPFKIREASKCKGNIRRRSRPSDYGLQVRMKQIIKFYYGVSEKQFRSYFKEAARRSEPTGITLIHLLEKRLDNVVYRLGFATTRAEARQLVSHGHVQINGKKVTVRSCQVQESDTVSLVQKARQHNRVTVAIQLATERGLVDWVKTDFEAFTGSLIGLPELSQLPEEFSKVNLVVELYSK